MRNRLVGAIAALAVALGALAFPSAEPAQAASACTGWTSSFVPPTSIRVYRTTSRRTQTVSFRRYVEKVMASEWGTTAPPAALEVGAIAVKQYAWYYAMHWRGGRDRAGQCYDVVDTTRDQLYNPSRTPTANQLAAVAATWWVSFRKGDRLFLTGYRAGTGSCTANVDGWRLYQRDAVACVRRYGDTAETVARRFYSNLSWVVPGAGDVTGDGRGDVPTVTVDPATGATTATVTTADTAYSEPAVDPSLGIVPLTTTPADRLLGRTAADVTGDRRPDLVQLVRTDTGTALEVMVATPSGYAPAATWWSDTAVPTDPAVPVDPALPVVGATLGEGTFRLVVGDFTGDGIADAAIVRIRPAAIPPDAPPETPPGPPRTDLLVAASSGTAFAAPRVRWSAPLDLTTAELRAGDFSGDGRADLAALTPLEGAGTTLHVAASTPSGELSPLAAWATERLPLADLRVLVADANGDGRDDLVLVRRVASADGTSDLTRVIVYRGGASGAAFSPLYFTGVLPLPFETTRFAAADLDGNGRADLVAFADAGLDPEGNPLGTKVWRLVSAGTTFGLEAWLSSPTMRWETTFPY